MRTFGHDALEGATSSTDSIKKLVYPDGQGRLDVLSAVLADDSFAPSVAAACKALAYALKRSANSIGAQLHLHLYRRS